jgi:hypothetical protein
MSCINVKRFYFRHVLGGHDLYFGFPLPFEMGHFEGAIIPFDLSLQDYFVDFDYLEEGITGGFEIENHHYVGRTYYVYSDDDLYKSSFAGYINFNNSFSGKIDDGFALDVYARNGYYHLKLAVVVGVVSEGDGNYKVTSHINNYKVPYVGCSLDFDKILGVLNG